MPIREPLVVPDNTVYTGGFMSDEALDVSDFRHVRVEHSAQFVDSGSPINGIENFWNQAKWSSHLQEARC